MLKLQDKKQIADDISSTIQKAQVVGVFGIRSMPNRELETLRRSVKRSGGYFKVAKRSLIWKASEKANMPVGLDPKEPLAMVADFDEDMTALKSMPNKNLSFIFGIFQGKVINKEEIMFLQNLPDKQTLRGNVILRMKIVLARFVNILKAPEFRLHADLTALNKSKS